MGGSVPAMGNLFHFHIFTVLNLTEINGLCFVTRIGNKKSVLTLKNAFMKSFLLLCTGCLMAVISQAHIIYVPGDYPSIQQGINAATPGDTILVAEGTYYEQINFLGKKPLMVASEFLTTGNVSHIANTIIDGSLIPAGDNSSVVYFINGEDSTSVICGFTIQGGHGSSWSVWGMHGGGGVYCLNGASILNNIIQNNEVTVSNNNAGGGGILVVSTSPVHVSDNIIRNNVVDCQSAGYTWAIGGGIMCVLSDNCRHTIYGNIIEENEVHTSSNYSAGGGGILIQECSVLLDNNVLKNNSCSHTGSSISKGGALEWYIYKAGSCIRNNAFINNISGGEGGGVRIETTDLQELLIENNHFEGNHSIGDGGAVATVNSKVRLQNNVFSNNESKSKGGACYISRTVLSEEHMLLLINNSFSNNHAFNGGAVSATKTKPLILNSVFWNDSAYYNS
jgi:predicted outer membrane repeat protein